ncbi:MAG: tetratricopeptide repeat protein [Syntrophaceae bacterium]|nr:tetratricopeptide repeat protein [Syntrophaceae bacterium]
MLNKIKVNSLNQKLIIYIVLTVITLAVFGQVHQFDFINIDDDIYVTDNSYVQSGVTWNGLRWAFSTTHAQFWHPLTWLSLMFDNQLYGLNAGGYHVTNVILHILSVLLLFWLFNRMTGSVWKSAFVAAYFSIHPLRVESVAWIAERKDVLSAFFWMLTLCFYVYYTEKPVIRRYFPVFLCFLCALMSKPIVVTLPIIMILLDYWPLKRFDFRKRNVILWQLKEKTLFIILSIIFSIITLYAQYNPSVKHFPLNYRLAGAPVALVTYLEKIFWPYDLAILYPLAEQFPTGQVLVSVLLIFFVSAVAIIMMKRLPYIFVGWLWYVIGLLPVIGITQTGPHSLHDLYTYLPSIGIAVMLAWSIPLIFHREAVRKKILFFAGIIVLVTLSFLTWKQCGYWQNSITLLQHDLKVTKGGIALAHNNIAVALADKGNIEQAMSHYNEAIRLKPKYADPYNNKGTVYGAQGKYQLAIDNFNRAIALKPDFAKAHYNRGTAYAYMGRFQTAMENYNEAIRLKPDYSDAYINRAFVHLKQGNTTLGCYDAQRACSLGDCSTLSVAKSGGYCP